MTLVRGVCFLVVLLSSACGGSAAPPADTATDGGIGGGALCIARGLCTMPTYIPSGVSTESCYDGCNWCTCTSDGQIGGCTARACFDGGS